MAKTSKVTGPTTYVKPLTINEKEAVRDAISDWRDDGVQMVDAEADLIIQHWVDQMTEGRDAYFANMGGENEHHIEDGKATWWYECIFLKSDDTCIGVNVGRFDGLHYIHSFIAIRPAYRNQGYQKEVSEFTIKTLFTVIQNCESCKVSIPTDGGNLNSDQIALWKTDSSWNNTTGKTKTLLDRVKPVEYQYMTITKAEYLTWLNLPANAAIKNGTFSYEIIDI